VAAVNASDLTLGTYSSAGPATTLFGVPTATTVPGPALAGVDGLPVSLPMDGEENLFFGTSAAAPTVAAVAALAVQAAPGTTPAALRDALVGGARADAFASPWPSTLDASRFSGAGLTDAVATVAAVLPPAPTPTPTPVPTSVPTPTAVPAPDPTAAPAAASPPGRLAESGTSIDGVALGTGVPGLIAGLADVGAWQPGQLVLHTDPAYGARVLDPAAQRGAIPLAIHPAIVFTGASSIDLRQLAQAYAAVTAPGPVLPIAQALAVELGCEPVVVAEEDRTVYAEAIATATEFSRSIVRQSSDLLTRVGVDNPGGYLSALVRSSVDQALIEGAGLRGLDGDDTIDG